MWTHNLNPTLLSLGPLEIRWYGLVYVLGFFLSVAWMYYLRKENNITKLRLNLTPDEIWDFTFYLMVGVIIGSRLFMIFWQPQTYLFHPLNLFKIWQGGMSFHGGLTGIIVAAIIYCKKKKLNFWKMADILSIPTMLALALGRIANFINGELVGRVSNDVSNSISNKWCVIFPNHDNVCRHPSTLYAAGKRFLILFWLFGLTLAQEFKPGFIFWNFVFFEGLGRFIVDFYREDTLYTILNLSFSLGQWFSLIMVVISGIIFLKWYQEDWKRLLNIKKSQTD